MQKTNYQFAYHVSQIAKLMYLGQTSKIKSYAATIDEKMQEKLHPWLSYTLANAHIGYPRDQGFQLSDHEACTMGWQAYYQHDYLIAHAYFVQAIENQDWQKFALNSALGLAKVYTRTGHWLAARDWCLYYLSVARQQSYHFEVAKGYGALAEIFLRASYANEALACFQTAYHLMPLGQGQQSRQYNFMASALMRNKEALRAEVLLHTSRQISRNILEIDPENQEALASLCHSTMRFYYLNSLQFDGYEPAAINTADERLMARIDVNNALIAAPLGLLQVAKGIACLPQDMTKAASHFAQAMRQFTPALVTEYQWAERLNASCLAGAASVDNKALKELFSLQAIAPPTIDIVLDQTWQKVPLDNQGFLPLLNAKTPTQLADLWTLFFI